MRSVKKIVTIFLGLIFMMSSAGVLIFQSECSCTGTEQVSVYVTPSSCEDEIENHTHNHSHHQNTGDFIHDCEACTIPVSDCGCESPKVEYVKLNNQIVQEKSRSSNLQPVQIQLPALLTNNSFSPFIELFEIDEKYKHSPQITISTIDYLVFIQQLKIPASA